MFNALRMTYTVDGEAFDLPTMERITDQVYGYAFEDMHNRGVYPLHQEPHVTLRAKGDNLKFRMKWKVRKIDV